MNFSLLRYRLILRLLAPAILLFNAWQALRARQSRLFFQRLALRIPQPQGRPLWLHAASVGEVIAAQALVYQLRAQFPHIPLVISTTTATGAHMAASRLPAEVQHFYFPVDCPSVMRRLLNRLQPRALLIMETELWPNLMLAAAKRHIPLLIINGRLSHRTLQAAAWVKRLLRLGLQGVTAVLARSKQDAENYLTLGAAHQRVQTLGNIKFALTPGRQPPAPIALSRPYVLAASTHDDEELQLARLWQDRKLAAEFTRLLVIAPRHPQRCEAILKQLETLQLKLAVRSRNDIVDEHTQIYLADTLGELEGFMAGADVVFMGGSLVAHGGQNILEPARLGKPIMFGPHMHNFSEETALLLGQRAALQVKDHHELADALQYWLREPALAAEYGQRARQVMAQQGDILSHYVAAISGLCELARSAANEDDRH